MSLANISKRQLDEPPPPPPPHTHPTTNEHGEARPPPLLRAPHTHTHTRTDGDCETRQRLLILSRRLALCRNDGPSFSSLSLRAQRKSSRRVRPPVSFCDSALTRQTDLLNASVGAETIKRQTSSGISCLWRAVAPILSPLKRIVSPVSSVCS